LGIKAFAPASIGNIGIGFDIMGLCLDRPGDEVIAKKSTQKGLSISKITGHQGRLSSDPTQNTAGVAVQALLDYLGESDQGLDLEIHKKLPLGSGMGSSAASAVAAVVAVSELLRTGMSKRELLSFACTGEALASGSFHADNVAPSMIGGIVLVRDHASVDVQRLHVPKGLCVALVHPKIQVMTKAARGMLSADITLKQHVAQSANIAAFVVALYNADLGLLQRCLTDQIIEPQRAGLIPGFYDVKDAALSQGVLGCSISGAGPSVFALCHNNIEAEQAAAAMQRAFSQNNIESEIFLSGINQEGAVIC
jgi:homoserine kinase